MENIKNILIKKYDENYVNKVIDFHTNLDKQGHLRQELSNLTDEKELEEIAGGMVIAYQISTGSFSFSNLN